MVQRVASVVHEKCFRGIHAWLVSCCPTFDGEVCGRAGFARKSRVPLPFVATVSWVPHATSVGPAAVGCLATARGTRLDGESSTPALTATVAKGVMHESRVVNLERGIPFHSHAGSASGWERMVCKQFMFVPVALSRLSHSTCGGGHLSDGRGAGGGMRGLALAAGRVPRWEPYRRRARHPGHVCSSWAGS